MKRFLRPRHLALGLAAVGVGVAVYAISLPLRASAQKTQCQSNLKQIGLATMQYTRDYDELFMLAPNWESQLKPYLGFQRAHSVEYLFACPKTGRDYAFNAHLSGALLGLVQSPPKMAMFYEPSRAVGADTGESWSSNGIHGDGSNVSFQDGHVKWLQSKPTFFVPELADVAGAIRRRDEASRRAIAQSRATYALEKRQRDAYLKKQRPSKP